jgi:hypothetical protein
MKNSDHPFPRGRSWRALAAMAAAVTVVSLGSTATASAASHPAVSHHRLGCHAYVTTTYPRQHTRVGITVVTKTHARVKVTAHFKTLKSYQHGSIKRDGRRTFWYNVGRAPVGITVNVHVRVNTGSQTARCNTWFTPKVPLSGANTAFSRLGR